MPELPPWFDKFTPPPKPPEPVLASGSYKAEFPAQAPRRPSFTFRDWQFLAHLQEFPDASNGQLAKVHGMGVAAASARVKRLVKLGLIEVSYEHSEITGHPNKRTAKVITMPDKPWTPE